MALLEKLQRRASDLGLWYRFIQLLPKLALFCGLIGMAYLALWLPSEGQYRHTYISENALMPSQAYSYFRETEWNLLRGYRAQLELLVNEPVDKKNVILAGWLEEIGLKTAVHKDADHGDSLYGVWHAPRGDGTEAMVLAAPWHNGDGEFNLGGTALATALTRYFSRWPLWSKNIIVVFSEDPKASLRSWCHAYHTSLDLTGGSIESAVVLDYPGANDFFKYVEIFYAGLNGELPNLDLVNVAVHITQHEGMRVSLNGIAESEMEDREYYGKMKQLLLGVRKMALAGVQACYGNEAFSGYRIQSIVLRARGSGGPFDITTFGRVPEAMFRSVNNLLEKFHQSFFFYLLLAPQNFVSIASYLPAAVAFSAAFIMAGLDHFFKGSKSITSGTARSSDTLQTVTRFIACLMTSYAVSQVLLQRNNPHALISVSVLTSMAPLYPSINSNSIAQAHQLKSISFLYLSVVLTSLLVVNFALAFGIGLLAFPMIKIQNTTNSRLRIKNSLLLLATNPFIASCAFANIFETNLSGFDIIRNLVSAWNDLGCWTWFVVCIGWLPVWISVAVSSCYVAEQAEPNYHSSSDCASVKKLD
ncbi:LADA_0F03378g1_1 [Lachancea dasiensis]|uniref:LADA_0F03378g1_1 n=1 Tax=Lachancea dasiensis TaxID=1072105 RepID=A0A1G4JIW2_9SACH|nr:LADA_0F03378g1_1 [Lachancea dasiensis]